MLGRTRFLSLPSFLSCFLSLATAGCSILGSRLWPKSRLSMGCEASALAGGGRAAESREKLPRKRFARDMAGKDGGAGRVVALVLLAGGAIDREQPRIKGRTFPLRPS